MATTPATTDETQSSRVQAVLDDIRRTRGSDFINAFWRHLAFDPALLESTWAEAKRTMVAPSALDPLTKALLYIAVSVAYGCSYCVHSHTAAARAKGMTEAQHADVLAVIGLAGKTNHLATALQVPVDPVFDLSQGSNRP